MTVRPTGSAAGLVVASPVTVWCLIGDMSETRFDDLDYLIKAPQPPRAVELLVALLAVAVMIASAVALVRARVPRRWAATVVPIAVAGAMLALSGRMITAGVIGANIGAGLAMFIVVPTAVVLIVAGAVNAAAERWR